MRYDSSTTMPLPLETQIRSLLNTEWPGAEEGDAARPLLDPELHPVHFVLADGDQVLSYARTIWATISHIGQSFKLYGLGDVITKPEFRHRGHARRVVEMATIHIKSDRKADAGVLLTEPKLEPLYRRSGWKYVSGLRVKTGEHSGCATVESFPMILILSEKAYALRDKFGDDVLVLPGDEW